MKKFTLLCAMVLVGLIVASPLAEAGNYKYTSKPHARIMPALQVSDRIYVPAPANNQPLLVSNVRLGIYAQTIRYSTLVIELTSPGGRTVRVKNSAGVVDWPGQLGTANSYALFRDGGNALANNMSPCNIHIAPSVPLALFDGDNAVGWWTIRMWDEGPTLLPQQDGYLEGWTLMFNPSVIKPETVIWTETRTTTAVKGFLNGQRIIPNKAGDLTNPCAGATNDPIAQPGVHGDAFGFYCPVPGTIGNNNGRFRVRLRINNASGLSFRAENRDIAVYFGKVQNFTGSWVPGPNNTAILTDPVAPAVPVAASAKPWPRGGGNSTNQLLPFAGANTLAANGGVRLYACESKPGTIFDFGVDDGFNDITFFDSAIPSISIDDATVNDGTYRGHGLMSTLNGNTLAGLYYVTIYDTYGENIAEYGQLRIDEISIEYVEGGYAVPMDMHQGIVGPFQGIPTPGALTGVTLGYLYDNIATFPPYSIHAKDQDPIAAFWGVQKMYYRDASGFERVQAVDQFGSPAMGGTLYNGPYAYAYPKDLAGNPVDPGTSGNILPNTDNLIIPTGDYRLRLDLSQTRYDDDIMDNTWYSPEFKVTDATIGYYGDQVAQFNPYIVGLGSTAVSAQQAIPFNFGFASAFTLFKWPSTLLSSIDYKFDMGLAATPRSAVRVKIWRAASTFFGAPSILVGQSPIVGANEYVPGNWRSFPINGVTAQGPIALSPGTYFVTIENASPAAGPTFLVYPYTYKMMPSLATRHFSTKFNDKFGPIGPFATTGTRMGYLITSASTVPVFNAINANVPGYDNFTMPIRMNVPNANLTDFAINYVRLGNELAQNTISLATNPILTPSVIVSNNTPTTTPVDCNVRFEIYDTGNNLVYQAPDVIPQFGPGSPNANFTNVTLTFPQWTPTPGVYTIKVWLSRKPMDHNPANDMIVTTVNITATRAVLFAGNGVTDTQKNDALGYLANHGIQAELAAATTDNVVKAKNTTFYLLGTMPADVNTSIQKAMENGNDVAFVYNKDVNEGSAIRNMDNVLNIQRNSAVNYDNARLIATPNSNPVPNNDAYTLPNMQINSKEDIVNYIRSVRDQAGAIVASTNEKPVDLSAVFSNVINTPSVDGVSFMGTDDGFVGVIYAVKSAQKNAPKVDAATPAGFALEQNYPNPFNPSTVITYTIAEPSVVTLRVMDLLGREVMTLVSSKQNAGTFSVTWNGLDQSGASVASGTYMYRIDAAPVSGAPSFTSFKKMTLSK